MKYIKKIPETDITLSQYLHVNGWIKIKEPKNLIWAVLFSFPLSCLLMIVTAYMAYLLKPELFHFINSDSFEIVIQFDLKLVFFVIAVWGYLFIHEMIHAMLIPNFRCSEKTWWGLNGVFGFVFTAEPIKKCRFQVISCMPFILLSIVMLSGLKICGYLNGYTFSLCLINAAGSCVDFLNIILIGVQVKRGSTIISNGFETYYRFLE